MSRTEQLKFRLQCKYARCNPLMNDVDIGEVSQRYEWFAYFQGREWRKRLAAESRRLPYRAKIQRLVPISEFQSIDRAVMTSAFGPR